MNLVAFTDPSARSAMRGENDIVTAHIDLTFENQPSHSRTGYDVRIWRDLEGKVNLVSVGLHRHFRNWYGVLSWRRRVG